MAHDKVYGFCESKCKVEVPTKKEFDTLKTKAESFTGDVYQLERTVIGSWRYEEGELPVIREVFPKKRLRYYYELGQQGSHSVDVLFTSHSDVDGTGVMYRSGGILNNFNSTSDAPYLSTQNTGRILRATAIMDNGNRHELQTMKSSEYLKEFNVIGRWFFECDATVYENIKSLIVERVGV